MAHDKICSLDDRPQDSNLVVSNITPEWLANMFDGNGSVRVENIKKAIRTTLELSLTQQKCPKLLEAIKQLIYPGVQSTNPHTLRCTSRCNIQGMYQY